MAEAFERVITGSILLVKAEGVTSGALFSATWEVLMAPILRFYVAQPRTVLIPRRVWSLPALLERHQ